MIKSLLQQKLDIFDSIDEVEKTNDFIYLSEIENEDAGIVYYDTHEMFQEG
jgi:hypothetical protein